MKLFLRVVSTVLAASIGTTAIIVTQTGCCNRSAFQQHGSHVSFAGRTMDKCGATLSGVEVLALDPSQIVCARTMTSHTGAFALRATNVEGLFWKVRAPGFMPLRLETETAHMRKEIVLCSVSSRLLELTSNALQEELHYLLASPDWDWTRVEDVQQLFVIDSHITNALEQIAGSLDQTVCIRAQSILALLNFQEQAPTPHAWTGECQGHAQQSGPEGMLEASILGVALHGGMVESAGRDIVLSVESCLNQTRDKLLLIWRRESKRYGYFSIHFSVFHRGEEGWRLGYSEELVRGH